MPRSKTSIIAEIAIKFNPKNFKECCIGITSDEKSKLLEDHNISENDIFFYETTDSIETARELEKKFVALGMNRFSENTPEKSGSIFVYKKNAPVSPQ